MFWGSLKCQLRELCLGTGCSKACYKAASRPSENGGKAGEFAVGANTFRNHSLLIAEHCLCH